MVIEPTFRTAAIAGTWAVGFAPFEPWLDQVKRTSLPEYSALAGLMFVIFIAAPVRYMVIGRNSAPFGRTWFLDAGERVRFGATMKRGLVWLLSAFATGTVVGIVARIVRLL